MNTMVRFITLVTLLTFIAACEPAQPPAPETSHQSPKNFAFTNVAVVNIARNSGEIAEAQTVLVVGDRITTVGATSAVTVPSGFVEIDGTNQFLMAGLTEMHGHVPPASSFGQLPERYLDDVLFMYVANGVTTVRGMLGYPHQLQLKQDITEGKRTGPTLYLAGPSFNGNSIESPEKATQRVIEQRDQGWDLLKVHPGLTLSEYQAMAKTARGANIDFAGHVPKDVGLEVALTEGQRTIDHLDGYLEAIDALNRPASKYELDYLVDLTLRHGAAVVPTQALWATIIGASDIEQLRQYEEIDYVPEAVRAGWFNYLEEPSLGYFNAEAAAIQQDNRQRLIRALFDGGVPIIFGTDAPQLFSVPGFSALREITVLHDAGIPLAGILHSATVAAGEYFADKDLFGRVAEGHRADLVLLQQNPLEDPAALAGRSGVMVAGQWLDRATIDNQLEAIRAAGMRKSANFKPEQTP
ncbi:MULTISPECIES: amidohydrolase family protein [Pseudidiomarina]|uniref:Imidazolonepropionase-like amidohydrolase n=2 Tax=Pseudidiomarina TaxID=2800384 RepID=A0A368USA8_9GAMM|nr:MULTISPECIES: amidohydrolase family protein [Pseudidiomarina]PWW07957.1 imidazolonepropionase-like amidohydrolase [Pseudidiomarina maritima]RBP90224.1 imidazolonepropionase-like amidohydrolase [Pseudidiomarina tainanensis]RCW31662.1 imidazolonepropionase-like amidohydrolase [Pseudidiomarina tainanensis]